MNNYRSIAWPLSAVYPVDKRGTFHVEKKYLDMAKAQGYFRSALQTKQHLIVMTQSFSLLVGFQLHGCGGKCSFTFC